MSQYVTVKQAAKLVGVNPASFRHAIRRGSLAAIEPGQDSLVTRDELDRYIRARRTWRGYARATRSTPIE